jgi:hypothetical protein
MKTYYVSGYPLAVAKVAYDNLAIHPVSMNSMTLVGIHQVIESVIT